MRFGEPKATPAPDTSPYPKPRPQPFSNKTLLLEGFFSRQRPSVLHIYFIVRVMLSLKKKKKPHRGGLQSQLGYEPK